MIRIVLTTGGTGGHIFPALSVAEAIKALEPTAEVVFVGGGGPEGALATKAGLPFVGLPAKGIFGRGIRGLAAPLWMGKAFAQAARLLKRARPQAVVGFGGYAGFIPVAAAKLLGIPTAIHEQNSVPGMANRLLGRFVDKIFVTYPDRDHAFPLEKTSRLGNPIRGNIAATQSTATNRRHLLVLGGSQGAQAINDAVLAILPRLLDADVKVRLQTGRGDFERVQAKAVGLLGGRLRCGNEPEFVLENFIENMAEAYAWADLVLGRSGASTLAEATAAGKPAVLIPFPYATHNHQAINAAFLADAGAAVVIGQADLPRYDLAEIITDLFDDPGQLATMRAAAIREAKPQAAQSIAEAVLELVIEKGGAR